MTASEIRHTPIPSSEFIHIDRADSDPLARCMLCGGQRYAFYHYYDVPVCFVCQYDLSGADGYQSLQGAQIALSYALKQQHPEAVS